MKLALKSPLGRTGLLVPRIIYGTSYLGNLYRELPYGEKLGIISRWFACTEPPVVIDTAGKYGAGLALEVIGKGLSDLGVDPGDLLISNKLGWYRVPLTGDEPSFEPGAWAALENDCVQAFGYEGIMDCFRQGNELLGGRYRAGLVSVHDPDEYLEASRDPRDRERRFREILESYRALFDLKAAGEVMAVGIGSKDWSVILELFDHVPFDWIMLANSFTIYRHPAPLMDFMEDLQKAGVGIINSALFHGGFLTGGDQFDYRRVDPVSPEGRLIEDWREAFHEVCHDFNLEPWQAALRFGLSHPAINAVALNTSNPLKMHSNVEALNLEIPPAFWSALKSRDLIDASYNYL